MCDVSGLSPRHVFDRLREAGLGSTPGTAAEVLHDGVRERISPNKLPVARWVEIIEASHAEGIRSTVTVMFGHVEEPWELAEHMRVVRELQERTGGFTEFVPLSFIPFHTLLGRTHGVEEISREENLKHTAAFRLALGKTVPNLQASWVKMGLDAATESLHWGVNDLGGTLMEESISRMAGQLPRRQADAERAGRGGAPGRPAGGRAHDAVRDPPALRAGPSRMSSEQRMPASADATSPTRARSLTALLETQADHHPDANLLRGDAIQRTCAQMREAVARRAGSMHANGIQPGDRVAIMSNERVAVLDLVVATIWAGAIAVPVNVALRGAQLAHVLADSAAKVLVIDADMLPALSFLDQPLPALERVWILGRADRRDIDREVGELPESGDVHPRHPSIAGDLAMILYTSGTTGPAKGVLRSHGQMYWWGLRTAQLLELGPKDVLYTCLPLFHTNALNAFAQAVASGATFVPGPRFSAGAFWEQLTQAGSTVTYLLGPMAQILARRPPGPWDRAHHVRTALSPATAAELYPVYRDRFGIELIDAWGATEANVVLSTAGTNAPAGSMGSVVAGFEALIADEHDNAVPAGQAGELLVRAREPFAFASGYNNLPEATVAAWRNLWLHTGDSVVRDDAGWFWFVDRLKDSIRRRGENISSYEVEQALGSHPDVASVAVVPVPADIGEDEVMAFVVPRQGAGVDPEVLVRFCAPRLAYFAIPRFVEIVDALPMTENGKVEKYRLRELGVQQTTWDRIAAGVTISRDPALGD